MKAEPASYRYLIERELVRRSDANPRYSLRAMARALRLQPGALSQVLSGKRIPSFKMAQKILASLELTPDEQNEFIESLAKVQRARGLERLNPKFKAQDYAPAREKAALKKVAALKHEPNGGPSTGLAPKDLNIELFRVIGDWYHYAIMMLTYLKDFEANPNWIAARLGITPLEAKLAVERLLELGLLKKQGEKIICWESHFTTTDKHLTSAALKRHQRQVLEKSIFSLENDPIDIRNHSSVTMAIDPAKLGQAKKLINEFMDALCELLESGKRQQIYELNIGLFPLQKNALNANSGKRERET